MVKVITYADDTVNAEFAKKFGSGNDVPPNWHEVTEAEISRSLLSTYEPTHVEYRQILPPGESHYLGVNLMFMHDGTGFATHFDYHGRRVRWFAFGCDHTYVELGYEAATARGLYHGGSCYHVYECTKCHNVTAHDSSD